MIIENVKEETMIDSLMNKTELQILQKWFKTNKYKIPLHPLRKLLDASDAELLGAMLDMFHNYRCNKLTIDNAVNERLFSKLPKGFNPVVFRNMVLYCRILSDIKFAKQNCPERFADVLLAKM